MTHPDSLGTHVGCLAIAIVGQPYVVMLIGVILGRFKAGLRR